MQLKVSNLLQGAIASVLALGIVSYAADVQAAIFRFNFNISGAASGNFDVDTDLNEVVGVQVLSGAGLFTGAVGTYNVGSATINNTAGRINIGNVQFVALSTGTIFDSATFSSGGVDYLVRFSQNGFGQFQSTIDSFDGSFQSASSSAPLPLNGTDISPPPPPTPVPFGFAPNLGIAVMAGLWGADQLRRRATKKSVELALDGSEPVQGEQEAVHAFNS